MTDLQKITALVRAIIARAGVTTELKNLQYCEPNYVSLKGQMSQDVGQASLYFPHKFLSLVKTAVNRSVSLAV